MKIIWCKVAPSFILLSLCCMQRDAVHWKLHNFIGTHSNIVTRSLILWTMSTNLFMHLHFVPALLILDIVCNSPFNQDIIKYTNVIKNSNKGKVSTTISGTQCQERSCSDRICRFRFCPWTEHALDWLYMESIARIFTPAPWVCLAPTWPHECERQVACLGV